MRRNAASGVRAVAFSEIPPHLGLPSIHSGYWDPFFRACEETKTVVCMHIGSSSRMPATSPDAPVAVAAWLSFDNAMASLCDFLFLGGAGAVPDAEAGRLRGADRWLPYILERADDVWREHWAWAEVRTSSPSRDNVTFETDDPHTDSTWPDTKSIAEGYMAGLDDDTIFKVMRGNALRMLDRPQDWTAG